MIEKIITIGEKGQITIPKVARKKWHLKPGDTLKLLIMPSGTITIQLIRKTPEERVIDVAKKFPKINVRKMWKEIKKEREFER